jgi:cysteine desulfurase
MIYLDNAATTRVCESAITAAREAEAVHFYNPSALYGAANAVKERILDARKTIASVLCCEPDEVYFTSGATEANNLAVFGGALKRQKLSAVTSDGEHTSVYECFVDLKRRGLSAAFIPLKSDTRVKAGQFIEFASQNCGFASLLHVSNETGAVNDVARIFKEVKKINPDVILHADGVQGFCKIETDVQKLGVDLYSVSGHKIGGAKGIGALYIRKGLGIRPLIVGGGQENGIRAGTENVGGILSFAAAVKWYREQYRAVDFLALRELFVKAVSAVGGVTVNGVTDGESGVDFLPGTLSLSVSGVKSEILQRRLSDEDGILIGTGSACAASKTGNRVLAAAGKSPQEIAGNIRISFGIDTTKADAQFATQKIAERIKELRGR